MAIEYRILKDGVVADTDITTPYTISGLTPETPYALQVERVVDGFVVGKSNLLTVTTDEAGSEPVEPQITIAFVAKTDYSIAVSINANYEIGDYDVLVNGVVWTETFGNESGVDVTGLNAETEYTIQIDDNGVLSNVVTETTDEQGDIAVTFNFANYPDGTVLADLDGWEGYDRSDAPENTYRDVTVHGGKLGHDGPTIGSNQGWSQILFTKMKPLSDYTVEFSPIGIGTAPIQIIPLLWGDIDNFIYIELIGSSGNISNIGLRQVSGGVHSNLAIRSLSPVLPSSSLVRITVVRDIGFTVRLIPSSGEPSISNFTFVATPDLISACGVSNKDLRRNNRVISSVTILENFLGAYEPNPEIYNGIELSVNNGNVVIQTDMTGTLYYVINQSSTDLTAEFIQQNATGNFETVAGADTQDISVAGWFHAVLWDGTAFSNVAKVEVV